VATCYPLRGHPEERSDEGPALSLRPSIPQPRIPSRESRIPAVRVPPPSLRPDDSIGHFDEPAFAACEQMSVRVADRAFAPVVPAVVVGGAGFDGDLLAERDGAEIFDGHLRGERDDVFGPAEFPHRLIHEERDDPAVRVIGRAFVAARQAKRAVDKAVLVINHKPELHALGVVLATAKAEILRALGLRAALNLQAKPRAR